MTIHGPESFMVVDAFLLGCLLVVLGEFCILFHQSCFSSFAFYLVVAK